MSDTNCKIHFNYYIFLNLFPCKIVKQDIPIKVEYHRVISRMIIVDDDAIAIGIPNIAKREILLISALPTPPGIKEITPISPERT